MISGVANVTRILVPGEVLKAGAINPGSTTASRNGA
jgi:hypothetical protein